MKENWACLCRMNKMRPWLTRLCFYGLFFAGPCLLSDAHAIYVKKKILLSEQSIEMGQDEAIRRYDTKECVMKWVGIGCSLVWIVWLTAAVAIKLWSPKASSRACGKNSHQHTRLHES